MRYSEVKLQHVVSTLSLTRDITCRLQHPVREVGSSPETHLSISSAVMLTHVERITSMTFSDFRSLDRFNGSSL
ncbi:hypothetical protein CgunFtcFv8_001441 [Champsocephalus gunnari]|nr:hypothetical protein CgunFtcFv8_001441 [Champsocephalus gunnari]